MLRRISALATVLSLALSAGAQAADDLCSQLGNLVSRPTVSTTACAIGLGSVMIETGYTNQSAPGSGQTILVPQTTVRGALADRIEFVFTPPSAERVTARPVTSGETDGMLGIKYQFASAAKVAEAASVSYVLGTGTPELESTGRGIAFALDSNYSLTPALSLSSTLAYVSYDAGAARSFAGRSTAFQPSLGLSISLPANISLFGEGFGKTQGAPGGPGQYGIDGGISYDAGSRLQFDANAFDTIGTSGGRSHAIGFGAAYLFGAAP